MASVSIETELDPAAAGDDEALQARVRRLFALARKAVAEELEKGCLPVTTNQPYAPTAHQPKDDGIRDGGLRRATGPRVKEIQALAPKKGIDLAALMYERWWVRRAERLPVRQASPLIDHLKGKLAEEG